MNEEEIQNIIKQFDYFGFVVDNDIPKNKNIIIDTINKFKNKNTLNDLYYLIDILLYSLDITEDNIKCNTEKDIVSFINILDLIKNKLNNIYNDAKSNINKVKYNIFDKEKEELKIKLNKMSKEDIINYILNKNK